MSSTHWLGAVAALALFGGAAALYFTQQSKATNMPTPTQQPTPGTVDEVKPDQPLETATFGAGCFWGVEAAFRQIKGVKSTAVGYLGGDYKNPTYKDVCTGRTGHAEVVQVTFDPTQVTYEELLEVFWSNHDPTTLNRQGPDIGTQYRSAVFYHNEAQRFAAESSKQSHESANRFKRPIVTEVSPASEFYAAEDYHQQYLEKRGLSKCHM